jgi:hypothetical protein
VGTDLVASPARMGGVEREKHFPSSKPRSGKNNKQQKWRPQPTARIRRHASHPALPSTSYRGIQGERGVVSMISRDHPDVQRSESHSSTRRKVAKRETGKIPFSVQYSSFAYVAFRLFPNDFLLQPCGFLSQSRLSPFRSLRRPHHDACFAEPDHPSEPSPGDPRRVSRKNQHDTTHGHGSK